VVHVEATADAIIAEDLAPLMSTSLIAPGR